jgi:hypothetical protein
MSRSSSQANVRSIEPLMDLKAALAVYAEEATGALGASEMELRRVTRWLCDEQGLYWQGQIKKRRELVAMARAELSRKKLGRMHGHSTSHSEQQEAVEKAEKRLAEAEFRLQKVKKWIPVLQQASMEYHATTRRLQGLIGGDVPRSLALLERVMNAIESYLAVTAPSGATPYIGEVSSSPTTGGLSAPPSSAEAAEEPPTKAADSAEPTQDEEPKADG